MTTLRWLHLSDFHTGKDKYGQNTLFGYLIDHIKHRVETGCIPDFVFITGDVADMGKSSQYQIFNEKFLFPLIDILPQEVQNRVYLIPGNHDADRSKTRAVQAYDILLRIPTFFDPEEEAQFERNQAIFPRFQAFAENDIVTSGPHWLSLSAGVFHDEALLHGKKVGILGVNTAWLSSSDYDRHKLSIGKPLLENGLNKIKDCDLKFVLGHHPIDWFLDEELAPVRALLGRHNVIYLHGHMHKSQSQYDQGAGYSFLSLQSGACFQAREDDQWVNRFMWCEFDVEKREISVEPLQWSRDHQEWALDAQAFPNQYRREDRWILSMPSSKIVEVKPSTKNRPALHLQDIPHGWVLVDSRYLRRLAKDLTSEQALSFFDGRNPKWREALSPRIPRRKIVNELVKELNASKKASELQVRLLVGAAGEGKTTALLQTICNLVNTNNDWHILWHDDPNTPFPADFIVRLPKGGTWLIASDDAEVIAQRVFQTTQSLMGRNDIHFLLCSRDTDWKAAGADTFAWEQHVNFKEIPLRGFSREDAREVIQAWSEFGQKGLGELYNLPIENALDHLLAAARSAEVQRQEGSFFGAILQVRLGSGLKDHVRDLLNVLSTYSIGNSRNLKDAFTYIAAMHAENLQFLSKEVLAKVLEIELSDLKRKVLFRLGEEAAIATTGRFVFTRHHAIAKIALQIVSEDTDIDTENIYIDLSQAAISKFLIGEFVPNIADWNYLSSHFFEKGNQALGIRLAQAAVELDPKDPYFIAKLSRLYREAQQPEQSIRLFHSLQARIERADRSFYNEWGTAEGHTGNYALNAYLVGYSLSDEAKQQPPDKERTRISCFALATVFEELYKNFNLKLYLDSCYAAAQLALKIEFIPKEIEILKRLKDRALNQGSESLTYDDAFDCLVQGIVASWNQREHDLPSWISTGDALNFKGLSMLFNLKAESFTRYIPKTGGPQSAPKK